VRDEQVPHRSIELIREVAKATTGSAPASDSCCTASKPRVYGALGDTGNGEQIGKAETAYAAVKPGQTPPG
jgi:hypothetical protein